MWPDAKTPNRELSSKLSWLSFFAKRDSHPLRPWLIERILSAGQMDSADQALYSAKSNGRNKVVMFKPPSEAEEKLAAE